MARLAMAAIVVSAAFGCRAPASKLADSQVLRFGVSHREGSQSFTIRADGTADYVDSGGPQGERRGGAKVSPAELKKLAAVLEENGFCSLVSSRSTGVPDEARPAASVRMQGLDCEVQMWDGEFDDDPSAKAALAAIESLGALIRARGE